MNQPAEGEHPQLHVRGKPLPRRYEPVLRAVVRAESNKRIAKAAGLSQNTVRVYLSELYRVFEVAGRTELAMALREDPCLRDLLWPGEAVRRAS